MNRYLKLVQYELHRFRKIYISLFAITALLQFFAIYQYTQHYQTRFKDMITWQSITEAEYVAKYGLTSFYEVLNNSVLYFVPIFLCITTLILYLFMIWYRDWLGKNTFVYRLLMLPTARKNLYLSKASAIMIMVLGLVAFQLLLFPLQIAFYNLLMPESLRETLSLSLMLYNHEAFRILIPRTFIDFILYYAAGLMSVFVIFTAVLIERSYRFKGAIGGICYIAAMGFLFFLPMILIDSWFPHFLYPAEFVTVQIVTGALIGLCSLALGFYLLNKKVTV